MAGKLVAFCCPFLSAPTRPLLDALGASVPLIEAAGWAHLFIQEQGCPYISHARATMLRKALDAKADVVVFLDYDLSWRPQDLLALIETEGECVAGLYRFKKAEEVYMGVICTQNDGTPVVYSDGTLRAEKAPAGFLKITKEAVDRFMKAYPELTYGPAYLPSTDLFNHGAHKGVWYGEDYAFSRRWRECGGAITVLPDLDLVHHSTDAAYPGNYHEFLMRQPGGSNYAG